MADTSTDIITGQYVRIAQTPASVGDRIVARIIDYVILAVYVYVMIEALSLADKYINGSITGHLSVVLVVLPVTFYSLICETCFRGQSVGKHIRHMRVVSMDGAQPTLGQLMTRWLFLLVDVWVSCVGILPITLSRRHQRFGDMAAGTMVIREGDYQQWHAALDDFYWLTPGYQPTYPQAQRLSDAQARLIDRTLHGQDNPDPGQVARLAEKVAKFLAVTPGQDGAAFLTRVYHDYQYYTLDPV